MENKKALCALNKSSLKKGKEKCGLYYSLIVVCLFILVGLRLRIHLTSHKAYFVWYK